ncbi:MAG TPA: hypothetical protein VI232_12020, partial [Reyranella sp.]
KPYSYMSSFWSPLDVNRIVVMVGANQGAALVDLTKQMEEPDFTAKIQGDFFFSTEGRANFTLQEGGNSWANCHFGGKFNGLRDLLDLLHSLALFVL